MASTDEEKVRLAWDGLYKQKIDDKACIITTNRTLISNLVDHVAFVKYRLSKHKYYLFAVVDDLCVYLVGWATPGVLEPYAGGYAREGKYFRPLPVSKAFQKSLEKDGKNVQSFEEDL